MATRNTRKKTEKWIQKMVKEDFKSLAEHFHLDPVTIRLMVNRGVRSEEEIERFLYATLEDLYSPWLLKDMEIASEMIMKEAGGKIAVSSDFDCDGIFAAYILKKGLERIGLTCEIFTPERVSEGYGLNRRIIEEAIEKDCTMVLTCDNGIAAADEIAYAKEQGLKVIVTDHHDIQGCLPPADAIIDHKQEDCPYPFQELCGAGIAYKLVQALYEKQNILSSELEQLLEFVALATVADVMKLQGENRILVREGILRLQNTENLGIRALIEAQGLKGKKLRAYHIGYILGPCFNASGRLSNVQIAFELLDAADEKEAAVKAEQLKALNDERKRLTEESIQTAFRLLDDNDMTEKSVLVYLLPDCHESLAGIIAGQVKERYYRPSIIFVRKEDGVIKGSGRSIPGFNMFEKCCECSDLFIRFGGHPMAAGITMREEHLQVFEQRLNECSGLTENDLCRIIEIDIPMPVRYITETLIGELEVLEPFGNGNTKPVFAEAHFQIAGMVKRGYGSTVLALMLKSQEGTMMDAVLFGQTEQFENFLIHEFGEETLRKVYAGMPNETDVNFTYYPIVDEYNGFRKIKIQIGNYGR